MQAAIDRVMQTYGMMVHLTAAQEDERGKRLCNFLKVGDEQHLAVETQAKT